MGKIAIIKSNEVEQSPFPGCDSVQAGWMKRIIYPPHVNTNGTFMGIAEVEPGNSPHRWHTHTKDTAKGYEVVYPDNFEEVYHIISGDGVVQWKSENGIIMEENVEAGDTMFFPAGVPEHQLFNNGKEKIVMVFCGSPPPQVKQYKEK
jgi:mannose-6-phosphate isomerase-like protein (cupin superfamily)